jgi:hypothetical protein
MGSEMPGTVPSKTTTDLIETIRADSRYIGAAINDS